MTVSGPLAYRVDGEGEAVLLLNGGLMSIAAWEPIAAPLAARYRVIRCDFRGQLLSPGEPPADLAVHAADAIALLDHLGIAAVHAVGTSFGAEVGAMLAATHPDRILSLLAAAAVDAPGSRMQAAGERLIAACQEAISTGSGRAFFAAMFPVVYSPSYLSEHRNELELRQARLEVLPDVWFRGALRLLEAIQAMDLRPLLGRIRCPTLVVVAGDDGLMERERSLALAVAITGAQVEVVRDCGHALVVERAERFVEVASSFLASCRVRGPEIRW
jgi:pimeloyl-ACP methyl ester carboxylesterase